jgi:hypothetical protein
MAEASPVDTALFAFRKREQRFVLTGASIAYLIASLMLGGALIAAAWPALSEIVRWYAETMGAVTRGDEPSAPPVAALLGVLPWYGLFSLLALALYAAYEAACLRWLVRGERGGLLGLTLGGDTWRVFAVYLVWLALGVVFLVVVVAVYAGIMAASAAMPALRLLLMLLAALTPLALAAVLIWFAVRLSPASAACIARRRFAFFEAWTATRGRFWEMLGAFVILWAAYLAVTTLLSVPMRFVFAQAMYPAVAEAMTAGSLEAVIEELQRGLGSPLFIAAAAVYGVVSIALALVFYVGWFGVNARVAGEALIEGKDAAPG